MPRFTQPARRPVDYTQRSTKLKLFTLVAGLIVVLAVAERARDPKAWRWLWQLDQRLAEQEKPFNNRLTPQPLRTAGDPAGTFVAEAEENPTDGDDAGDEPTTEDAGGTDFDPVARAWEQGWKDVYDRLEPAQQSLLFEMLHASRNRQALPADKGTAAADLLQQLDALWEDYQSAAFQSVAELQGDDRTLWVDVLRQVNGRFANEVRPALQSIVDGRTATEAEEHALAGLQRALDKLTTAKIEDDTFQRPAERQIWFRQVARVRDTEPAELLAESVGQVAYLQLHKQPADYRGEVVTVEGTVLLAYRVDAVDNFLGIKEHYVYWIHPQGGPNAPIVVYAQGAPPGFPAIAHRDIDGRKTKLHEDVTVTGVFFKRWAYAGQDGTYTAPLILANVPTWTSAEKAAVAARPPLGPREYAAMVAAALLMSLCVTAVLWRRSRRQRPIEETFARGGPNLSSLRDAALAPSPEETLRNLEREARRPS